MPINSKLINQPSLKEMLRYESGTGHFYWRVSRGPMRSGTRAGGSENSTGYERIVITANKKKCWYYVHRLAWYYVYGTWPEEIDHIDGNRSNNSISNLRAVTRRKNCLNMRRNSKNTSGHTGISWDKQKKRWRTVIWDHYKQIHLGFFADKSEAVYVRKAAERDLNYHPNHGTNRKRYPE